MSRFSLGVKIKFWVQVAVVNVSYTLASRRKLRNNSSIDWVVGTAEIASMVHHISNSLPNTFSVVVSNHAFYSHRYNWEPKTRRVAGYSTIQSLVIVPALFGYLAAHARGFIYVGNSGFLNTNHTQREYEFRFLKRTGCTLVCYFTGNDIRSIAKMRELEASTGVPNFATYYPEIAPSSDTEWYEASRRRIAEVADKYADHVFTAAQDQRGYLEGPTHQFMYFYPDAKVASELTKFQELSRPVIVHASSSPVIKGTQLARAAVAQLRAEGFDFEYVELMRAPHARVEAELKRAHIVLNQFYSSMPGVFGVEAMAAGCVLVTSASQEANAELQLPSDSNSAWIATPHYLVTENLRSLLTNTALWEAQAQAGLDWVRTHASASASAKRFLSITKLPSRDS